MIKNIFKKIILTAVILIGMLLIFTKPIMYKLVAHNSAQAVKNVTAKAASHVKPTYDPKKVNSLGIGTLIKDSQHPNTNQIGILAIPAVNIKLPIFIGISDANLAKGVGTMRPNEKVGAGNYALAGHHMENPHILLSPLSRLNNDTKIQVITRKHIYTYQTKSIKIIAASDINSIKDSKKAQITLITCASGKPGETRRICVKGDLIQINHK